MRFASLLPGRASPIPPPGGDGAAALLPPATTLAPGPPPAVAISGLRFAFSTPSGSQARALFDGFGLTVAAGECVALVGQSGSGKTTLLRLAAGLLAPQAGEVRVLGLPTGAARRRKALGFMFQAPALLPWRTVLDNVLLPLEVNGSAGAAGRARAADLLAQVGLRDSARLLPHQLSGGMQQRAALARALVTDPPLLLMDEPFSALDEFTRAALQGDFLRLRETRRPAALLVTHSIPEALLLADRVVALGGEAPARIVADLPVDLPWPRSGDDDLPDRPEFTRQAARIRRLLREA